MNDLSHYLVTTGHPGGHKSYCRIQRHLYWPSLGMDCCANVPSCTECAKNRIDLRRNVGSMKQFIATAQLESVSTDILHELILTLYGQRSVITRIYLVVKERFKKIRSKQLR